MPTDRPCRHLSPENATASLFLFQNFQFSIPSSPHLALLGGATTCTAVRRMMPMSSQTDQLRM